jgi:uncharacterized membrane protein YgcG
MMIYPQNIEDNMRDQSLVEQWRQSGFLDAGQAATLRSDLQTPMRTTNSALRAVLALFTILIIAAATSLTFIAFAPARDRQWTVLGPWAVVAAAAAWLLAREARLYRCGVEESLATLAVCFLSATVGSFLGSANSDLGALLAAVLGSVVVYLVFGYRYAIVGATVLAGLTPFALKSDAVSERLLSLLVFALAFFIAGYVRRLFDRETPEEDLGATQAAAYAGFYLTCNLMITSSALGLRGPDYPDWFYWSAYAAGWVIPALALWHSLRVRDRMLLNLSWLSLLGTILTNKSYLRVPRNTWDPILLGMSLIVVAIVLRRWLARGPDGERNGFTPVRLLQSEEKAMAAASALSLVLPQTSMGGADQSAAGPAQPASSLKPGGGRSGGGGASGSF